MGRTPVVVVVPYHNEQRYLPQLIASLRAQRGACVPAVFVDNASTDGSAAILRRCDEVRTGQWVCIEEKQVGKFFAMRTAAAFCAEQLSAEHVAFLDADSYCADSDWVANCVRITAGAGGRCGYSYSPFMYFGFEHLPRFAAAYRAYQAVTNSLAERIGWSAPGMGFLCATDVLQRYLDVAQVTTEVDLRLSLFALCEGRAAYWNPSLVMTSGRRIAVNPRNFTAWCFYDPAYYEQKDINAPVKLDLNLPTPVEDLPADLVGRFFHRRALKLASRHLIPVVIFEPSGAFLHRVSGCFGGDVSEQLARGLGYLRRQRAALLSDQFEAMIGVLERHPVCVELASRIERLMDLQYAEDLLPRPVRAAATLS